MFILVGAEVEFESRGELQNGRCSFSHESTEIRRRRWLVQKMSISNISAPMLAIGRWLPT